MNTKKIIAAVVAVLFVCMPVTVQQAFINMSFHMVKSDNVSQSNDKA